MERSFSIRVGYVSIWFMQRTTHGVLCFLTEVQLILLVRRALAKP